MLSRVLALHLIFLRPDMERSHRVSMNALSFSPDGKDFCQFMTPNLVQPHVFGPFPPGAGGDIFFYPNMAPGPGPVALPPGRAQPGPGTGLSLAQGQGSAWAWACGIFFLGRGWPTPIPRIRIPLKFSAWGGGNTRFWLTGGPRIGISGSTPSSE